MPEFGCRPGIKKAVNLWNTANLNLLIIFSDYSFVENHFYL